MKIIAIVFVFLLSACSVSVKDSFRNPDYKQTFDKISVKWIPRNDHVFKKNYVGNSGYVNLDPSIASSTVRKHLYDLQTRTQELLFKELLYYDTDIVEEGLSNYVLQMTPDKNIKIYCGSASCQSAVTVQLIMKERKSDVLIWSSAIKVTSPTPPYTRTDLDGKEELVTPDTTQELAESIIGQWNKYQLLPARLASPRALPPSGNPFKGGRTTDKLDKADVSYEKLLSWIKQNNKWGADAALVKEFQNNLETAIGGTRASWKIGWGLTRSGKAYGIGWTKKMLSITELPPEEAALKGFREMRNIFTVD